MKKQRKSNTLLWIIATALFLAALAAFLYFSGILKRVGRESSYTLEQNGVEVPLNADMATMTAGCGNLLIRSNRSGVRATDAKGNTAWDVSYNMSVPRLMVAGDYVMVADLGGTDVVLVKSDGAEKRWKLSDEILLFTLNEQGKSAIVISKDDANELYLFAADGTLLLMRHTYQSKDGIPTALALSPEGSRLMVASFNYTGTVFASNIIALDLSGDGAGLTDRILGSAQLEDALVAELRAYGYSCFFVTDESFGAMDVSKGLAVKWQKKLDHELCALCFGDGGTMAFSLGDAQVGITDIAQDNFFIYNIEGNCNYKTSLGKLSSLNQNGGIFVWGDSYSFGAVNGNGKVLWSYDSLVACAQGVPLADGKTVALSESDKLILYTRVATD